MDLYESWLENRIKNLKLEIESEEVPDLPFDNYCEGELSAYRQALEKYKQVKNHKVR